jgi:hypothetical protein
MMNRADPTLAPPAEYVIIKASVLPLAALELSTSNLVPSACVRSTSVDPEYLDVDPLLPTVHDGDPSKAVSTMQVTLSTTALAGSVNIVTGLELLYAKVVVSRDVHADVLAALTQDIAPAPSVDNT